MSIAMELATAVLRGRGQRPFQDFGSSCSQIWLYTIVLISSLAFFVHVDSITGDPLWTSTASDSLVTN